MAGLPLLTTQSGGLHPSIRPQPQRPPPPRQPKLAVAGPAELVTCDQTIEHTVRFCKQALGWTTPRPRHPEQADRWTWLVLAAYTQLRLARQVAADVRLPWSGLDRGHGCHPIGCAAGFRSFWSGSTRRLLRRNPQDARQAGPKVAAQDPRPATQRSTSPPRSPRRRRSSLPRPPDRLGPPSTPADLGQRLTRHVAELNHKLTDPPRTRPPGGPGPPIDANDRGLR
jgi:hypothetical protein